jgi:hypothetical protein
MRTQKAAAYARQVLGDDYARRFTVEEDRTHLCLTLEDRGVAPEIIDRVMRLNPVLVEGQILRGLHYKAQDDPRFTHGFVAKGDFIRRFGRDAFERLSPRRDCIKRGRRVYVTRAAVQRAA